MQKKNKCLKFNKHLIFHKILTTFYINFRSHKIKIKISKSTKSNINTNKIYHLQTNINYILKFRYS